MNGCISSDANIPPARNSKQGAPRLTQRSASPIRFHLRFVLFDPFTLASGLTGHHPLSGVRPMRMRRNSLAISHQHDLRAGQLFGDNSPRTGRVIFGRGETADLPPNSSLFAAWEQNYFPCRIFRVTLRPAWVPGRSDLKQVSCAYGCTFAVFLEKFPHFSR